jgi:hypothetical protein
MWLRIHRRRRHGPAGGAVTIATRIGLRDLARVREIDRQLYSIGLKHRGMKWVVTPALGVLGVTVLPRILDTAGSLTTVGVLVGMLGLLPAAMTYIEASRRSRTAVAALESERSILVSSDVTRALTR